MRSETTNAYYEAATRRGVEVIPVRSDHPYDPRIVRTLVRLIRAHRIDIVHSHEYKSDLLTWLVARVHPMPIMSTVHGWITNSTKSRLFVGLSQKALGGFGRVVAVSNETRRKVVDCGVPEDRIVVLHNAIVTQDYQPERHERGFLRQRFGLPADATVIGNIGRLSPEKGQADFIEAAAVLAATHPRAYFVLAGDGPSRAALEQQSIDRGLGSRMFFTGHLADVRPVYRDLDILALTSHTEGFPNVVLESLCMDVPVLATNVGGTSEAIQDGTTGVLVPAACPAEIARGLRRMLDASEWARSLAAAGRVHVYKQFSFAERVTREEDVYKALLEEWRDQRRGAAVNGIA